MLTKILIANRGEIACRVIDTCKRLGVATVAVYSDADANARHVKLADEAIHIGPAPVADSYLQADRIIQAALDTGAQAVHPGYGFLSENPEFADALAAAGLIFIGPSADAIRAMGLKDAAKALMQNANVPVVPGYHGSDQDDGLLASEAEQIGYPVLIKAVAGGGGKGMRLVDTPANFMAALASARSEAKTAFGNSDVLVEKFVTNPRHIEIQVFGDNHGDAVYLFERDCSLQRRHQKVIEEAPAPGMTDEVRAAMGNAAVAAAKAIGYSGAGTVEFIVDGSGPLRTDGFWFMEMNTRLQVEHPVTEAITGQDLVEWQLRVASGEPLPKKQDELTINGWAFEARLYAEDVPKGFLPATGTLTHLKFPAQARADTGVEPGDTITPYYDPMISKLIVHGPDRAQALQRLRHALDHTEVSGLVTNLQFLSKLANHAGFSAGEVDTGLIDRDIEELSAEAAAPPSIKAIAALSLAGLGAGKTQFEGFSLWTPLRRTIWLNHGDERIGAIVRCLDRGLFEVVIDDETTLASFNGGWIVDGQKRAVRIAHHAGGVSIFAPQAFHFAPVDLLAQNAAEEGGDSLIRAPMPGLVKAMDVTAGQAVSKGDTLAVLEAMKMEHKLTASFDTKVAEVMVAAGDQVEDGSLLIRLEEAEE
ncbi:MAG: acetyl/propionyl/methylcrotonyl-CoA carboxylase subunit alpha [Rhodobacteraceae bacterium]|nr:acetyl/propionyl/methylcrotonyl-CoA carboxylase subunit alpha [Paracoccaceae bacterium]